MVEYGPIGITEIVYITEAVVLYQSVFGATASANCVVSADDALIV